MYYYNTSNPSKLDFGGVGNGTHASVAITVMVLQCEVKGGEYEIVL